MSTVKDISLEHYALMAKLFAYPGVGFAEDVQGIQTYLNEHYPEAGQTLQRFTAFTQQSDIWQMEEVYTKTFHIQAICYLDLGFVVFGEDYKRGEFLVNMKHEQAKAGNDCGNELADNITNVLTLLPMIEDREFRDELLGMIIRPALDKMLAEFESSRMELKTKALRKKHKAILQEGLQNGNVYRNVLEALQSVINTDFAELPQMQEVKPSLGGAFLAGCSTCSTSHTLLKNTSTTTTQTTNP